MEDMALQHVDDEVAARFVEAGQHSTASFKSPQRCPASGARGRKVWRPDLSLQAVLRQRARHSRRAIVGMGGVRKMLQLAAAAVGKVAARGLLVAAAGIKRAVVEQHVTGNSEGHVTATCGNAI